MCLLPECFSSLVYPSQHSFIPLAPKSEQSHTLVLLAMKWGRVYFVFT